MLNKFTIIGLIIGGIISILGATSMIGSISSPNEIAPAIKRAIDISGSGQPVLLEMMTKEEENISTYGR